MAFSDSYQVETRKKSPVPYSYLISKILSTSAVVRTIALRSTTKVVSLFGVPESRTSLGITLFNVPLLSREAHSSLSLFARGSELINPSIPVQTTPSLSTKRSVSGPGE